VQLVEHYREIIRVGLAGRPLVLTGGSATTPLEPMARELGCPDVLSLHGEPDWRAILDRFDPDRVALVLGFAFQVRRTLAGRRFVGARSPAWAAYEDKTVVSRLWSDAGISQLPSIVVDADEPSLRDAAASVDDGRGTVWSGDHRDGEQHGGAHVRWVQTPTQAVLAAAHFSATCDRVRVMPFVEGRPCSIHGFVSAGGVAVLRPVEMRIRRDEDAGRFEYVGSSWDWTPPAVVGERISEAARSVGTALSSAVAYRGSFCVDGVLVGDDF
jgi:hypothetical protein